MDENQNKPSPAQDLQNEDLIENVETQSTADEEAMVAGVEAVGKISIAIAHIKLFLRKIWTTPKYRYSSIAGVVTLLLLLTLWPTTRYGTLNMVGIRASVRVTILDKESGRPVTGVDVILGDSKDTTDDEGAALLSNVRLGDGELIIDKNAYAESHTPVRVGIGSNTLDNIELSPIGTQFVFEVTDWLSQEPIENAHVLFEDNQAVVDEDGLALLQIPPTDEELITVRISADGYHELLAEINTVNEATTSVQLISGPQHYFMSRRNGNYDIFSTRLNGEQQELVIPGTGSESDDIRFSISPNNQFGALVSTRNGIRDANGRLQKSLHITSLEKPSIEQINESQDIQLVDWIGSQLIYVIIDNGESAFSPRRHLIMSYDTESDTNKELEASNHFNDVKVIQGSIFYAADDSFKQEKPKPYLYRMNADGTGKKAIIERQSWTIFRTSYDRLVINTTKNGWYEHIVSTEETTELSGQPASLNDYRYATSPNGKKTAWIEERDGKGTLLVQNLETNKQDTVYQFGGLQAPVRWIGNDKLIFRVSNSQETADYIVDLQGGDPIKIGDVSNVSSATRWFYY